MKMKMKNKFSIQLPNIPKEICNGLIKDFKSDIERNDAFEGHKRNFKDNVEYYIQSIVIDDNYSYIKSILSSMEFYTKCEYFHGLETSIHTCLRDIHEFTCYYETNLRLVYKNTNCPNDIKKMIVLLFYFSDMKLI